MEMITEAKTIVSVLWKMKKQVLLEKQTMTRIVSHLCLLGHLCLLYTFTEYTAKASEFRLDGDYLIGGFFDVHHVSKIPYRDRPETIDCSSHNFTLSSYRRFQLMRFAIQEINNSSSLLPNVSLGYEIFDYCTDAQTFPSIFHLMSVNDIIQPWSKSNKNLSKVMAVIGSYTSEQTRTLTPFFMMDLVPVISYGASSSVFSRKQHFPSFLRTLHPNQDVIKVISKILQHFKWRWVSFLYIDDEYGNDGLHWFIKEIKGTDICLAYTKGLDHDTNYPEILEKMKSLKINVIIVFTAEWTAEKLIRSAIQQKFYNKVWIAADGWSLHKKLPKEEGIREIGTVLGVAEDIITIPGFNDSSYSFKAKMQHENGTHCNQNCNCSSVTPKDVIDADPSFSFSVYSAVYAIAHALHNVLQCGADRCNTNITVHPQMVLKELKRSNFTLLNQTIRFDENGDFRFGSYKVVFWNDSDIVKVGSGRFHPSLHVSIDSNKIMWHGNGTVPTSFCAPECEVGYKRGGHKCCFTCTICPNGTYINVTEDRYKCSKCNETEWSPEGSTSCSEREMEYISFKEGCALGIMVGTLVLVGLTIAVSVLFALNYNTPVVRSAGGPMCFLILGCLSLSSISVFFYFGKPTTASCVLKFLPFLLFFTVCLGCFVVRSFQIVCIFKVATKFPKLIRLWKKYHGQWLFIAVGFLTEIIMVTIGYNSEPTITIMKVTRDKLIFRCHFSVTALSCSAVIPISLCILGFIFSYMGKSLPKNYSEAKAITFCLFLLFLIWIIFTTTYKVYSGKHVPTFNSLAVLCSLYSFLLSYFFPKCFIIIFQRQKNTHLYFQGLIQNYSKTDGQ